MAVFAICEAFDALKRMQPGQSETVIKEKVLAASMFLNLAKNGFEPETQVANVPTVATNTSKTQRKTKGVTIFPLSPGDKWNDLEISFCEDNSEIVKLTINGKVEIRTYAEMGFKDNKTGRPNKLWKRLQEFTRGAIKYSQLQKQSTEKDISRLKASLKELYLKNFTRYPRWYKC